MSQPAMGGRGQPTKKARSLMHGGQLFFQPGGMNGMGMQLMNPMMPAAYPNGMAPGMAFQPMTLVVISERFD